MPDKKVGGMVDSITLDHTNNIPEEPKKTTEEAKKEAVDELTHNGKLVATRSKNGDIICFDTNGQQINSEMLERLFTAYENEPEIDSADYPKEGERKIRFTKEITEDKTTPAGKMFKARKTIDCPEKDCQMVSWVQKYKDGQEITRTVESRLYPIVKFLRGEIDFPKKADKNEKEEE